MADAGSVGPVASAGHLYSLTDGRLACVDAATLRAGDLLVVTSEEGGVHLAARTRPGTASSGW